MDTNLAYQDVEWEKRREELIDGKTVMMSPRPSTNHNRVAERIDFLFRVHLQGKNANHLETDTISIWTKKTVLSPTSWLSVTGTGSNETAYTG